MFNTMFANVIISIIILIIDEAICVGKKRIGINMTALI